MSFENGERTLLIIGEFVLDVENAVVGGNSRNRKKKKKKKSNEE